MNRRTTTRSGRRTGPTPRTRALGTLLGTALAGSLLVLGSPDAGATLTTTLTCNFQGNQGTTGDFTITDTAPASVDPGDGFDVTFTPQPWDPSPPGAQAEIASLSGVSLTLAHSPWADYVPHDAPEATQTVDPATGDLTVSYTDPLIEPVGGLMALDAFDVDLTADASGAGGQHIEPTLVSADVESAVLHAGGTTLVGPLTCTPNSSGVLSSTLITDHEKPTIAITSPNASSYELGQPVTATFTCTDPSGCSTAGRYKVNNGAWTDVSSGQPLPTNAPAAPIGATVVVEAWATDGSPQHNVSATATKQYTVVEPVGDNIVPTATLTFKKSAPGANGNLPDPILITQGATGYTVHYSCADPGGSIASCTLSPNIPTGGAVATATAGVFLYTVTATDTAGLVTKVSRTVRILPAPAQSNFVDPGIAGSGGGANSVTLKCKPYGLGAPLQFYDFDSFDWTVPFTVTPSGPSVASSPIAPLLPDPPGTYVSWDIRMSSFTLPDPVSGHDVTDVGFIGAYFPKPSNGTWTDVSMLDSGVGITGPSASVTSYVYGDPAHIYDVASDVVLTPGPFTLPGIRVTAKADAGLNPGSAMALFGPDHLQFEMEIEYRIVFKFHGWVHVNCDRIVPPIMATTTLVNPNPPTATITSPANGQLVVPGSALPFTYACHGNPTAINQTVASPAVPSGAPLDTTTSGPHTVSVLCVDADGNLAQATVTYVVLPPTARSIGCTAAEGSGCSFTVKLSNPSQRVVKVNYATIPGTASSPWPADYQAAAGSLTFQPGETQKTVVVNTIADAIVEDPETFTLKLTPVTAPGGANASNAYISPNFGVGTINDATKDCSFDWPAESVGFLDTALQWWQDHTGDQSLTYDDLWQLGYFQWLADGAPSFDPAVFEAPSDDPANVHISLTFSPTQYSQTVAPLMAQLGVSDCSAAMRALTYYAVLYALNNLFAPGGGGEVRMILDEQGEVDAGALERLAKLDPRRTTTEEPGTKVGATDAGATDSGATGSGATGTGATDSGTTTTEVRR